jgi:histidinol phosphatase-like PHP family hydrolase
MLALLKERNIPLVLNADAHSPDHLGKAYETGKEFMKQAGYKTMVLFEGTENGKARWREAPI